MRSGASGKLPLAVLLALVAGGGFLLLAGQSRGFGAVQPDPENVQLRELPPPQVVYRATATAPVVAPPVGTATMATPVSEFASYTHPSGAFRVSYLSEWQIEEDEQSASFVASDGSALMVVGFLPTAADEIETLAAEFTRATWGEESGFALGGELPQADGSRLVAFSFESNRGVPMTGLAYVLAAEGVIFAQTVAVASEQYRGYYSVLEQVVNSLAYDAGAAQLALTDAGVRP